MNELVEHAAAGLKERRLATAHYKFSSEGLKPNRKLIAHAKQRAKQHLSKTAGEDASPYLELIRRGEGRWTAARKLGLDPKTLYDRMQTDEEFKARVKIAEAESLERIVQMVRMSAEAGDLKAAQFLLERKSTEEFGAPAKTLNINNSRDGLSPDEKKNLGWLGSQIRMLENDIRKQAGLQELGPGDSIIDIPEDDTEEI